MNKVSLSFLVFLIVSLFVALPMDLSTIPTVKAEESSGSFGNVHVPEIAFVNWSKFWQLFNAHSDWNLEYTIDGTVWNSIKSDLQIIKNYTTLTQEGYVSVNKSEASRCKITLNFTASYTADYRLTFGIDLDVKNYTHKESAWNYTLTYQNYTVVFDWSDVKDLPLDSINHGVKQVGGESWFWFRITKNNIAEGKNVIIDPSFGFTSKATGGTVYVHAEDMWGSWFTCPEAGTATSVSVYLYYRTGYNPNLKCAIYKRSDNTLVAYTEEWQITNGFDGFHQFDIVWGGTLENIDYILICWCDAEKVNSYWDSESGKGRYYDDSEDGLYNYNGFPSPVTLTTYNYKYSIFCNYTIGEQEENFYGSITQVSSVSSEQTWSFNRYSAINPLFTVDSLKGISFIRQTQISQVFTVNSLKALTFLKESIIQQVFSIASQKTVQFNLASSITQVFTVTSQTLIAAIKNFFGAIKVWLVTVKT